jgi:tetratricopeptide (TPR) repeat protein
MRLSRSVLPFALAALLWGPRPASAADPVAQAEQLFQEARKLADAGRYSEACPKFQASQKMAPGAGTLLNLGNCYEKLGLWASAYQRFAEVESLSHKAGRADREKTAREHMQALEPKLARVTIQTKEDVQIVLDGEPLDPSLVGKSFPIDPGKHVIEAQKKDRQTYSTTINVKDAPGPIAAVLIPVLEAPRAGGEPTIVAPPDTTKPQEPAAAGKPVDQGPTKPSNPGRPYRIGGIVAIGLGAAAAGLGTYFGLQTYSKWADAKLRCDRGLCDRQGVDLASEASSSGNISTGAFVASGVLVVTGVSLILLAPSSSDKAQLRLTPSATGLHIGGDF